jgi:hypothetical protein
MRQRPNKVDKLADRTTPEAEVIRHGNEPPHRRSITDYTDEALRSGVSPLGPEEEQLPGEDELIRGGDPDADAMANEYVGEETPGGPNSPPESNDVDEIGRLFGVEDTDEDGLRLGDDEIDPRDRARWELDPDSREDPEE